MNNSFPRVITLLRKERGLSQKEVARRVGISQALLSHYEKGVRECGLHFLVTIAEFYGVSCDYLLGRTPDRTGAYISAAQLPDPADGGETPSTEDRLLLHKKLIMNSLHIVFDLLRAGENNSMASESATMLMMTVYQLFRAIYSRNPQNPDGLFSVPAGMNSALCSCIMRLSEARMTGEFGQEDSASGPDKLYLTQAELEKRYPAYASSLFNLIAGAEEKINFLRERQERERPSASSRGRGTVLVDKGPVGSV